jgi:hypothetical protein
VFEVEFLGNSKFGIRGHCVQSPNQMRVFVGLSLLGFLSSVYGWEPVDPNSAEVQPLAQWSWKLIATEWPAQINLDKDAKNLKTVNASKQPIGAAGSEEYKLELTGTFSYGINGNFNCVLQKSAGGDLSKISSDGSFDGGLYLPMNTESAESQKVAQFIWQAVSAQDARIDLKNGTNLEIINSRSRDLDASPYSIYDFGYDQQLSGLFHGEQLEVSADVARLGIYPYNYKLFSYNVTTTSQIIE